MPHPSTIYSEIRLSHWSFSKSHNAALIDISLHRHLMKQMVSIVLILKWLFVRGFMRNVSIRIEFNWQGLYSVSLQNEACFCIIKKVRSCFEVTFSRVFCIWYGTDNLTSCYKVLQWTVELRGSCNGLQVSIFMWGYHDITKFL